MMIDERNLFHFNNREDRAGHRAGAVLLLPLHTGAGVNDVSSELRGSSEGFIRVKFCS